MPTEKGRYAKLRQIARVRAEKERLENIAVSALLDTFDKVAQEEAQREKYLRKERNSRKGESHLPETYKKTGEQIRDRLGHYYATSADTLGFGILTEIDETQCPRIRKSDFNLPETPELKRVKPKNGKSEYDPTLPTPRDGFKRPALHYTVTKAKAGPEPGIQRRAWKNLTEAERKFAKEKSK